MTKKPHDPKPTRRRTLNAVERTTPRSARSVLRAFLGWLEGVRLVSASTAYLHIMLVSRRFLPELLGQETACVRAIRRLAPADVEQALGRQRELKPRARRSLDCSASQFLLFCVSQGWLPQAFLDDLSSLSFRVPDPYWTPAAPRLRSSRAIARIRSRSARRVLTDYADWLEGRSLAASTIELRVSTALTLFGYWLSGGACVGRLRQLSVNDVESAFLRRRREVPGHSAQRTFQAGLRLFLRFCVAQGWTSSDLVDAVPSIRCYRLSTVPRAVSEADVPRLFAALERPSSTKGKRDRAVLLLLVTYGVRRGQVADLRLSDLDWRERRVVFRAHKGGRTVRHALTPAVAEALADYLRERSPEAKTEHVFLHTSPRKPVGLSPSVVTALVAGLFERAEISTRPRGPHTLRHAFAKRVLAARKPLKTVSDLLGHRALDSTAVYAKVDVDRLREAPLEWPEVLR